MTALSDKYIAGFLDSDGSVCISGGRLWVEFCQKTSNDGVLHLVQKAVNGGSVRYRESTDPRTGTVSQGSRMALTGKRAHAVLNRIRKHMVFKAQRVENLLAEVEQREPKELGPKNHPARAWLAGVFDGDGCITGTLSKSGSFSMRVTIAQWAKEAAGLELIQKAFGGTILYAKASDKATWQLSMDAAKAKQFFGYFAKHSLVKREQIYFVLGCAEMGHFRDGQTIRRVLKALKSHPHRLNDLAVGVDVSSYLKQVQDLDRKRGQWHDASATCEQCERTKLYANGLCNPCWQKDRYHRQKRQSEQA